MPETAEEHSTTASETHESTPEDVEYYHEKAENGITYMYSTANPDVPLCSGKAGTCRTVLDPDRHGSRCPSCKAATNLNRITIPDEGNLQETACER